MTDLAVLHRGGHSTQARQFQAAMNRRLRARDLDEYVVHEDGVIGLRTLRSAAKAARYLGALEITCEMIVAKGRIPIGVQQMVRNPGRRTAGQQAIARARMSQLRADRAARAKKLARASHGMQALVKSFQQAAINYTRNPYAYHYLAGGVANLIFLSPSPRYYRSDCSQFASAGQSHAGLRPLGSMGHMWVNTVMMASHLEQTTDPSPGDFGMYGSRRAPHHVEVYCALPGREFIGHGTQPIDSRTPGRPSFYLRNPSK